MNNKYIMLKLIDNNNKHDHTYCFEFKATAIYTMANLQASKHSLIGIPYLKYDILNALNL